MHVLLGPAHFRDVDQAFDAGFQLNEGAVVGDVGDAALDLGADRILAATTSHGSLSSCFMPSEMRWVSGLMRMICTFTVSPTVQHFRRMVDALPGDVGDVQQAVDAAQINECTVVGDVLDHAIDDLAFGEVLHEFGALFGAGFFQDGAARDDDVAAAAVHLEDLEGLRHMHQRADVADRADVDLRTGQEGHGAAEIDGEAALDAAEDDAIDALVLGGHFFETGPGFFAAGLVARQHGFAQGVFDALEIDFDGVAGLDVGVLAGLGRIP